MWYGRKMGAIPFCTESAIFYQRQCSDKNNSYMKLEKAPDAHIEWPGIMNTRSAAQTKRNVNVVYNFSSYTSHPPCTKTA